jgi:hypothetical protein
MLSEDDAASKSSQDPTPTANIAHFDKPIEKAHANQTEPLPVPKRMDISDWNVGVRIIEIKGLLR